MERRCRLRPRRSWCTCIRRWPSSFSSTPTPKSLLLEHTYTHAHTRTHTGFLKVECCRTKRICSMFACRENIMTLTSCLRLANHKASFGLYVLGMRAGILIEISARTNLHEDDNPFLGKASWRDMHGYRRYIEWSSWLGFTRGLDLIDRWELSHYATKPWRFFLESNKQCQFFTEDRQPKLLWDISYNSKHHRQLKSF